MKIETEAIEGGVLFRLHGRFDTLAAQEFEKQLMSTIEAGATLLIIDCKHMAYISSSTLRIFLLALKTIKRNNGKIMLTSLSDHIREVFDISGFLYFFDIFTTTEEALAAI